jgi:Choice-of-anchor I domain/Esterase-like activity of phytase
MRAKSTPSCKVPSQPRHALEYSPERDEKHPRCRVRSCHAGTQTIYLCDRQSEPCPEPNTRADKIGDAVSFGNGEFLVLERDDDSVPGDSTSAIEKKIYRFNLVGATDVSGFTGTVGTTEKTVDELSVTELIENGIRPLEKILHVDLNEAGYNQVQKVEGLTLINPQTLAVLNDNDFGVANIIVNPDGTFTLNYQPEPIQLGIIETTGNGLDASDRDAKINIRQWSIKGMYLPDAIGSYKIGAKTFLITANEGDAREYIPGLVEAVRLGSNTVTLDPAKFPNAAVLKDNANLGRLNITTTMGRDEASGLYTELFAFGARSFSVWDVRGELVYDSGDLLERIGAEAYPSNFNASNDNDTFDNRNDDKGPEPEGVVIGKVFGNSYAFIGLERIGGVAVFDVSDPAAEMCRGCEQPKLRRRTGN